MAFKEEMKSEPVMLIHSLQLCECSEWVVSMVLPAAA